MINEIQQDVTIPPAPPTGLYDADFQNKINALLAWFNTHAVEETTFIEKLNLFVNEVNGAIPLVNNGLPVSEYTGSPNNTFMVADAVADDDAVNKRQLDSAISGILTNGFCMSQTRVDETANRDLGITYQNTSLAPITLLISFNYTTSTTKYISLLADIAGTIVEYPGIASTTTRDSLAQIVVQPGETYKIDAGDNSPVVTRWIEIK